MTKEEKILEQINKEIGEYKKTINIGWDFNQLKTIEQAVLYVNGRYVDGDIDDDDLKLYFYNITRAAVGTTAKAIDLDTKDVLIKTAPGGNWLKTWFLQRDIKYWLKKEEFGKILNRISRELPQYGSVVIKYINNRAEFVNLKNLIVEQNADCLDFSNYIIEQHLYTPMEFKKIGKELEWDEVKIRKTIDEYRKGDNQYIRVFERYGEIEDENGDYDYKKVIFADIPTNNVNKESDIEEPFFGEILFEKLVEKHPYQEFHINKIPGRWLGVGVPEMLSDNQVRINELVNQQVKSSYWNTLRLWQGRDSGVARNLMKEAENGDVFDVEEFIQPIDMQDRNLGHFANEINMLEANSQTQTFTTDIIRGERTPAGTPLGSAQLSTAQALSYFDQMREDYALELKSFLWNFVIPGLQENLNSEHMIKIAGKDIDKLAELLSNVNIKNRILKFVLEKGKLPDANAIEMFKIISDREVKKNGEQQLTVPKDWYVDCKYEIEIDIDGESVSSTVKAQALISTLQAITTDPTMLTDPIKKALLTEHLEQVGISLSDYEQNMPEQPIATQSQVQGSVAGGGVSSPTAMQGSLGNMTV